MMAPNSLLGVFFLSFFVLFLLFFSFFFAFSLFFCGKCVILHDKTSEFHIKTK